jgi:ABC-type multidrug transport system fused ATPase/permease subunit
MSVLGSPGVMILATLMVAGFWAFTDTSSKWYRRIAGSLHGLTHTAVAVGLPTLAIKLSNGVILAIGSYWAPFIMFGVVAALTGVGAVFGAFVMGVYLHVSLNVFGRHRNEAFSALKEERYKSFLRLRIEEDGTTNLYVIGIERPPFDWEPRFDPSLPPDGTRRRPSAKYTEPFLVEKITLDGSRTAAPAPTPRAQ